jgi:type II secretory pathway pseudopilin PulG
VLLGLLVLLALIGATIAQFGPAWADERRRQAEEELLFVGQQYRQALESYYNASPGRVKHLPTQLDELLRDRRFPQPVRHLRKAWADPLSPQTPWGLVRQGQQIVGVYSQAGGEPFRRSGFDPGLASFTGARSYGQWQFIFMPRNSSPTTEREPTPSKATQP